MKKTTGIIVLAAGSSSRLGQPKQLLVHNGKSLIRHVVDEALLAGTGAVVVVTGANGKEVLEQLEGTEVIRVSNPEWEKGMAGSIKFGLEELLRSYPDTGSCIVSVCDQPHLSEAIFRNLVELQLETGKGIAASCYHAVTGVPALFEKKYFEELLQLKGHSGARSLIEKYEQDAALLPFAAGAVDIDTHEDYQRLERQMISVGEALDIISKCVTFNSVQDMPIGEACGYSLAEDLTAQVDIPGFAQSSMDGYALRFEDRDRPLEIIGEMSAGAAAPLVIGPGQAARIFTGAPLPTGADTVVMQEKSELRDRKLVCRDDRLAQGLNVRVRGAEVRAGEMAMQAGTFLSPAAVGYLSGIGVGHIRVLAPPKVAVILTGNELQQPGTPLAFGQVYESNSAQLRSALQKTGVRTIEVYHAVDDPLVLKNVLQQALDGHDVIMLVGGVSVGDYDFVTRAAEVCGVRREFHKIRQKPGKPLFFGTRRQQLIYGLPGNPSSSLTCFYEYVLPALERMMGLPPGLKVIRAIADHDYGKPVGLTHFLKAHYEDGKVLPLHAQESFRLRSFAQANCFMVLAEDSAGCRAGDEVEVHLIPL